MGDILLCCVAVVCFGFVVSKWGSEDEVALFGRSCGGVVGRPPEGGGARDDVVVTNTAEYGPLVCGLFGAPRLETGFFLCLLALCSLWFVVQPRRGGAGSGKEEKAMPYEKRQKGGKRGP